MKKLNNFINEKLKLNSQSKINNKKKFSDLEKGDTIYKMILHGNAFSDIYSCTIINIDNQDDEVVIDYACKNDRRYARFSKSTFYDNAFNYILIDSVHTDTYYFINKDVAKKVQTTHISNSIKKLQDELTKLKDVNNPNYRKNVEDREWQIELIEKELNELIEQSNKYEYVNEKLKLNSQSQLRKEYGDNWEGACNLLYDKIYEWHKEFLKNKRLLNSFVNWFRDAINSITEHGVSDYDVYDNIISELFNVNKISKEDYDKLFHHRDISKIINFCLFIMVKIINNPNQMMPSFSEIMKEFKNNKYDI